MNHTIDKMKTRCIKLKTYDGGDISTRYDNREAIREHQLWVIGERLDRLIMLLSQKGGCR